MKMLSSKWLAIVVPIAGIAGAVASVIWADDDVRLKMVTALGVLVLTRYVIRWIYQYGSLLSRQEDVPRFDRWERTFIWLFQAHLKDSNALGGRSKPVHIKLDTRDLRDLSGQSRRISDEWERRRAPAEVPAWWIRRMS